MPGDDRTPHWRGTLLHIHVAPAASYEMEPLDEATLIAGRGIEGDRYCLGTGTYSKLPAVRDVTLIEIEVLEADRRPVAASADTQEVRDVAYVTIREDRTKPMTMLFDEGHALDERILREQFSL